MTAAPGDDGEALPCEVCGGEWFEVVSRRDRAGAPLETGLCLGCGLVRHRLVPTAAALEAYYAQAYREDYQGEATPSPRRVVRAWRRGQALFGRLEEHAPTGGSVFEVGAGMGLNLKPFQLAGRRVAGVEPHAGWGRFARERLGVPLERGRLEELGPAAHDLVLMTHVLEHLRSPRAGLEVARGLLGPGGRLYLECPNVAAPFAHPARMFHRAHITNFSVATLEALAARAGLEVVQRYHAGPRDPTIAVLLASAAPRPDAPVDPANLRVTREALQETGWAGYHLRAGYLGPRLRKVGERLGEALAAPREYQRILDRCRSAPPG